MHTKSQNIHIKIYCCGNGSTCSTGFMEMEVFFAVRIAFEDLCLFLCKNQCDIEQGAANFHIKSWRALTLDFEGLPSLLQIFQLGSQVQKHLDMA